MIDTSITPQPLKQKKKSRHTKQNSLLETILERREERILLASPTMHGEEVKYVQEAFERNWIAPLGFNVDGFEDEMVQFFTKGEFGYHSLALASGTAALHLAVKLAGVKPGDIVLCSYLTFAATVNPVSYDGGIQVFIDSEYDTWNMDPEALERDFKYYHVRNSAHPKSKVVILVHLYGTPAKIDEVKAVCDRYDAILIEDAAESLSATYKGKETGTFGKYGAISFIGVKIDTGKNEQIKCREWRKIYATYIKHVFARIKKWVQTALSGKNFGCFVTS